MFSSAFIFYILTLPFNSAYATNDWCIENSENPPCNGARGRCTWNYNNTPGGFVADSAFVKTFIFLFGIYKINRPYIGKYVQICDSASVKWDAQISDHVRVYGSALVSGDSTIQGNVEIFDNAEVTGNAHISGNVRIFGNSKISGSSFLSGNVDVFGDAVIYGTAKITGNRKIFGYARIDRNPQKKNNFIQNGIKISSFINIELNELFQSTLEKCLIDLKIRVNDDVCSICLESLTGIGRKNKLIYTKCHNFFCKSCWIQAIDSNSACPLCRKNTSGEEMLEIEWDQEE